MLGLWSEYGRCGVGGAKRGSKDVDEVDSVEPDNLALEGDDRPRALGPS